MVIERLPNEIRKDLSAFKSFAVDWILERKPTLTSADPAMGQLILAVT